MYIYRHTYIHTYIYVYMDAYGIHSAQGEG